MARQDDDNYWTSSKTKGFDFGSEDNCQGDFSELFGTVISSSSKSTNQVRESIPHSASRTGRVSIASESDVVSISSNSSTGSAIRTQPSHECLVTNKILVSTVNVESLFTPRDVIRSLFLGLSVDLNCFKKLSDKTTLLDEAVKLGDGDIVTTVLLQLQRTLKTSVLNSILKERPIAAKHYLHILGKQQRFKEAAELCVEMKQNRDAAVHYYSACLKERDQKLLIELESLKKNEFRQLTNIDFEADILNQHIQLLQRQLPIAADDARMKRPEKKSISSPLIGPYIDHQLLVSSSLLATLQYCCQYHWNTPENLLASPMSLKKTYNLTERQFVWTAFIGLALAGADPLPVLVAKSFFGSQKICGGLSIRRLLEIAWRLECPTKLLDHLLAMIDSSQERCQLAKRFQRHRIVADVLISNKDRLALLKFRESIDDRSVIDYIDNALKVSTFLNARDKKLLLQKNTENSESETQHPLEELTTTFH